MTGRRLIVGLVAMGVLTPMVLFFLLRLSTLNQLFTTAATCFLAWGAADLLANVLSKPRLSDRTPQSALREWESMKREETEKDPE